MHSSLKIIFLFCLNHYLTLSAMQESLYETKHQTAEESMHKRNRIFKREEDTIVFLFQELEKQSELLEKERRKNTVLKEINKELLKRLTSSGENITLKQIKDSIFNPQEN